MHRGRRAWGDATAGCPPELSDRPIAMLDVRDARAYAHWAGLRLMTENEYVRAVRGDTERPYPWGERWEDDRYAVCATSGTDAPMRAGSYPEGASAQGILDLAGNVWEWTWADDGAVVYSGVTTVIVGGSFHNPPLAQRCGVRRETETEQRADGLGLRCAADDAGAAAVAAAVLDELGPFEQLAYDAASAAVVRRWTSRRGRARPAAYRVITSYGALALLPVRSVPLEGAPGDPLVGILSTTFALEHPPLPPGTYRVSWRASDASFVFRGGRSRGEVRAGLDGCVAPGPRVRPWVDVLGRLPDGSADLVVLRAPITEGDGAPAQIVLPLHLPPTEDEASWSTR